MGDYTVSFYTYEVKHKPSEQHGNTNGLSRLPLEFDAKWTEDTEDTVCLLEQQQLDQLPIKAPSNCPRPSGIKGVQLHNVWMAGIC